MAHASHSQITQTRTVPSAFPTSTHLTAVVLKEAEERVEMYG